MFWFHHHRQTFYDNLLLIIIQYLSIGLWVFVGFSLVTLLYYIHPHPYFQFQFERIGHIWSQACLDNRFRHSSSWSFFSIQKDAFSSLTFFVSNSGMFSTTSFPFQRIVPRLHNYFNQTVPATYKLIEWVYLMTY